MTRDSKKFGEAELLRRLVLKALSLHEEGRSLLDLCDILSVWSAGDISAAVMILSEQGLIAEQPPVRGTVVWKITNVRKFPSRPQDPETR